MRFLAAILALFSLLPPAGADYGQVSRCYQRRDTLSKRIIQHFLDTASACVPEDDSTVRSCVRKKLAPYMFPLVSPLLETVGAWEKSYAAEMHAAYRRRGVLNPSRSTDPWAVLRQRWDAHGVLCFYTNRPGVADHLHPREAGILTLFFHDGDLRSPILKEGPVWRFDKGSACAAGRRGDDGARQARFFASLGDVWTYTEARRDDMGHGLREEFSTDPFLQAVLTGWHGAKAKYSCPHELKCEDIGEKGAVYLPRDSGDYLHFLSDKMRRKEKVCVVFRDFRVSKDRPLDDDTYYISGSL